MSQTLLHRRSLADAMTPSDLASGRIAVGLGPTTRVWLGDGTPEGRLLISSNPADYPLGTANYLQLVGGTMLGPLNMGGNLITGMPPPQAATDAASKQYVDALIADLKLFISTWRVAANVPDIADTSGMTAGDYYIAVTADPTVPEVAPAGTPGIAGATVYNGDMVIWDEGASIYELIRGSPLTVADAEQLFVNKAGDTMEGPLLLTGNAAAPLQAVPLQQLTSTLGSYLPLTGGMLTDGLTIFAPETGPLGFGNNLYLDSVDHYGAIFFPTSDSSNMWGIGIDDTAGLQFGYGPTVFFACLSTDTIPENSVSFAVPAILQREPTLPQHATPKRYVDDLVLGRPFLPLAGGTMLGPLNYAATSTPTIRSAQDRADEQGPNVKDYGAIGDGNTDDTAAFQAAIATGRRIFVPRGLYIINAQLTPAAAMVGEGMAISILQAGPGMPFSSALINFIDPGPSFMRDLTLDCNNRCIAGLNLPPESSPGVPFVQVGLRLENLEIKNIGDATATAANLPYGLVCSVSTANLASKQAIVVSGCYVHDSFGVGISISGTGCIIANNNVINCWSAGISTAYMIDGVIIGNTINTIGTSPNSDVVADGITGYNAGNCRCLIIGNTVENNPGDNGIHFGGSHIQVIGNKIYDIYAHGIFLQSSPNDAPTPGDTGIIANNEIDGTQYGAGIRCGWFSRVTVTGNTIANTGQTQPTTILGSGVHMLYSDDCVVSGNIMTAINGNGVYADTALNLNVYGNRIDSVTDRGIWDNGDVSIGMIAFGNIITAEGIPTEARFAQSAPYLPLAGGTITGNLTVNGILGVTGNATQNLQAVPLQQLNSGLAGYLPLAGGTLSGNLNVGGSGIQYTNFWPGHIIAFGWNPAFAIEAFVDGSLIGVLATQNYVSGIVGGYLPLVGGTLSGSLAVNGSITATGSNNVMCNDLIFSGGTLVITPGYYLQRGGDGAWRFVENNLVNAIIDTEGTLTMRGDIDVAGNIVVRQQGISYSGFAPYDNVMALGWNGSSVVFWVDGRLEGTIPFTAEVEDLARRVTSLEAQVAATGPLGLEDHAILAVAVRAVQELTHRVERLEHA